MLDDKRKHNLFCIRCRKWQWKKIYNINQDNSDYDKTATGKIMQIQECVKCGHKRKLVMIDSENNVLIPLPVFKAKIKHEAELKQALNH